MKILGIKTSPSVIRYAIVAWDGNVATLLNAAGENRLRFPATHTTIPMKLIWLQDELDSILRATPGIERIAIKTNEYAPRRESGNSREAAYYDAVAFMTAGRKALPIEQYLYSQLATKRDQVMAAAEHAVGCTKVNWDEQMASAVLAAYTFRA